MPPHFSSHGRSSRLFSSCHQYFFKNDRFPDEQARRLIFAFFFFFFKAPCELILKRQQRPSDESYPSHLLLLFTQISPAVKLLLLILTGHRAARVPARAGSRAGTRLF